MPGRTITPAKHFNANIRAIPHQRHRYETVGDWYTNKLTGTLDVKVSQMEDWRYEFLVAVHELIEAGLCRHANVTENQVDRFDMRFTGEGEPGDSPLAPYYQQHQVATVIERDLCKLLGLEWDKYDEAVNSL